MSDPGDMVEDLTRARNRLTKFLLRHSRVWREGSNWTVKHEAWLAAQRFDERALQTTFEHYRSVAASRDAQLAAVEADLIGWMDQEPFAIPVRRLGAYRGVTSMGALALQAEVCDWRPAGGGSPRSAPGFAEMAGISVSEADFGWHLQDDRREVHSRSRTSNLACDPSRVVDAAVLPPKQETDNHDHEPEQFCSLWVGERDWY